MLSTKSAIAKIKHLIALSNVVEMLLSMNAVFATVLVLFIQCATVMVILGIVKNLNNVVPDIKWTNVEYAVVPVFLKENVTVKVMY